LIGERLQRLHPWLELAVVEESGHCPHDERPEEFHATVMAWLDRSLDPINTPVGPVRGA